MGKIFVLFSGLLVLAAASQQYVAFDGASASSTYSAGNLAGSPAFAAQQALSGGSGYWCSSGSQAAGQSVTWTGVLNSRRVALGLKVDWAYSPGEVKILTSSDGANFEEAKCWQATARKEVAFEETFMFDAPRSVKAAAITMRNPQSWGYFGINTATLIAEPGPFMLVSGITSASGEQCLVAGSSGVNLEPCLEAIAAGDGREVMQFDADGQIVSMADGKCLLLADGDTSGGGSIVTDACSSSFDAGDGRAIFAITPKGQLKMPRLGNYCLTVAGEGANSVDIAAGADVLATSSNAQHIPKSVVDGDAESYWASAFDPAGPVDLQLDFGAAKQIRSIEIDWEHPAQAFEIQAASGGQWSSAYSTSGNNLHTTQYVGPALSASALRIRMQTPHPTLGSSGGHALYGIKAIRVLATSTKVVVQDCVEAESNSDARDKFFMVAVPEYDASPASAAKEHATLLKAAQEHLGKLLAELYVAMPSLAACGFKASFAKRAPASMMAQQISSQATADAHRYEAALVEGAGLIPSVGVDMQALRTLVTKAREALAQIAQ